MVADDVASDTAVVRTTNPDQPYRVVLANCAGDEQIVSRTVRCSLSSA